MPPEGQQPPKRLGLSLKWERTKSVTNFERIARSFADAQVQTAKLLDSSDQQLNQRIR